MSDLRPGLLDLAKFLCCPEGPTLEFHPVCLRCFEPAYSFACSSVSPMFASRASWDHSLSRKPFEYLKEESNEHR